MLYLLLLLNLHCVCSVDVPCCFLAFYLVRITRPDWSVCFTVGQCLPLLWHVKMRYDTGGIYWVPRSWRRPKRSALRGKREEVIKSCCGALSVTSFYGCIFHARLSFSIAHLTTTRILIVHHSVVSTVVHLFSYGCCCEVCVQSLPLMTCQSTRSMVVPLWTRHSETCSASSLYNTHLLSSNQMPHNTKVCAPSFRGCKVIGEELYLHWSACLVDWENNLLLLLHLLWLLICFYFVDDIISRIESAGFSISHVKETQMTREMAENFYKQHHDKNFFNSLVDYMSQWVLRVCLCGHMSYGSEPNGMSRINETLTWWNSLCLKVLMIWWLQYYAVQFCCCISMLQQICPPAKLLKLGSWSLQCQVICFCLLCRGPSVVMILGKENAISEWREMMGPVDPDTAKEVCPNSMRACFAKSILENAVHGSSDLEHAMDNIRFIFGDVNI